MGFKPNPNLFTDIVSSFNEKVGDRISLAEAFIPEFMATHSQFKTLDEMIAASPIAEVDLSETPEALQRPDWNAFVARHSTFSNWEDMLQSAMREEVHRRLSH